MFKASWPQNALSPRAWAQYRPMHKSRSALFSVFALKACRCNEIDTLYVHCSEKNTHNS